MQQPEANSSPRRRRFFGWSIVTVVGLLVFASATETNPVLGIFQGPMTDEFKWSRATYSAPMSIGTILGGLLAIIVGPAIDRYGGRWILGGAAIVLGVDFLLMAMVQELWHHYLLQVLGRTLMASCFFLAISVIIPKWFVAKRGRAAAYAGMGHRGGQSLLPILAERMIALADWRKAWLALGAMVMVITVLPALLVIRRRPEDMGLLPDGAQPTGDAPGGGDAATGQAAGERSRREVSFRPGEVVRTRTFYLILTAQCFHSFLVAGTHFHWFSYFTDQGISSGVSVASLSILALVGMPVSLVAGFWIERVHIRYLLAGSYVALVGVMVLLLMTHTAPMAYASGVAMGAVNGVSFMGINLVWSEYYGRQHVGAIRGLVSPAMTLSNALGPLLAAVVFDLTDSYTLIYTLFAVLIGVAAVFYLMAVPPMPPQRSPSP